jgi:proline iminopeptidase
MTRTWKKRLYWTAAALVLLAAGGAAALWWFMSQPLYHPGDVRAGRNLRAPLQPPAQTGDRWIVEPGVALHHFASGTGRNALFVHGGPGFPAREPVAGLKAIEDRFRVHYYDQRGCGRSTRLFDRFTSSNAWHNLQPLEQGLGIGAQLADLERIRRILGDDKLVLIGHSFGAFLAALYAAEFPEHAGALLLIAPASTLLMPAKEADLFQTVRERLPESDRPGFDSWLASYLDFSGLFGKDEAQLRAAHVRFAGYYAKAAKQAPPSGALNGDDAGGWMPMAVYLSMGRRHDYRDALRRIRAPTLVLHGDHDLQSGAASREYAQLVPGAAFEIIPMSTHFPHLEQPDRFGSLVAAFLGRVP